MSLSSHEPHLHHARSEHTEGQWPGWEVFTPKTCSGRMITTAPVTPRTGEHREGAGSDRALCKGARCEKLISVCEYTRAKTGARLVPCLSNILWSCGRRRCGRTSHSPIKVVRASLKAQGMEGSAGPFGRLAVVCSRRNRCGRNRIGTSTELQQACCAVSSSALSEPESLLRAIPTRRDAVRG
jgi:hypothetical protein